MPTPKVDANRVVVVTVDGAVRKDELVTESLQEGGGGMKAFVVLNRTSGQEAHERVRGALDSHFRSSRIQYEVHETRAGEKLGEIVRGCVRHEFDLVVAAGGDGTVSAVIDGIAETPTPLGIIPTGTGNLIARELCIPDDVEDAVRLIAGSPRSRKIDVMKIGKRVFVLNASVGISAAVISDTTRRSKHHFGRIAYFWNTIPKMFTLKRRQLVVTVDSRGQEYRAIEVAIMNCGILAKMLHPKAPEIRIDDGHLDVLILGTKPFRDFPLYIFRLLTGRTPDILSRFIKVERCVTIRSSVPLPVQADGDMIGTTPLDVELLPGAVTVFVPEERVTVPVLDPARETVP
jgi:YegS/Rv2252/BmrU family lipid kinase